MFTQVWVWDKRQIAIEEKCSCEVKTETFDFSTLNMDGKNIMED